MANLQKVKELKNRYEPQWLAMKGVVAVGIGKVDTTTGIIISISENREQIKEKMPEQIEGVPIRLEQTGSFNAL